MSLTAAQLLRQFAVYGRYYSAVLDGRNLELRSHLEIFEPELGWPLAAEADADVVAIRMNPGASCPTSTLDACSSRSHAVPIDEARGARAGPPRADTAHPCYQPGRPAHAQERRAVRGDQALRDDRHRIFSDARGIELEKAMGKASVPVLRAWGLATPPENWARNCIRLTRSRRALGFSADSLRYRRPLPQRADLQCEWLEQLVGQVQPTAGGHRALSGG